MASSTTTGPAPTATSRKPQPKASPSEPLAGRELILAVAAERFLAAGYVETSLRDIATDAGMKAGSLYYHFDSKDDLLIAILERGMSLMVEAFQLVESDFGADGAATDSEAEAAGLQGPGQDRLARHVLAHLEALHRNLRFTAGHVTLFRTAPEPVREAIVPLRDDYEARWTALLAELLPERPAAEITMLRLALFGAMNASVDWLDVERGTVGEFAQVVTDQFWLGAAASLPMDSPGGNRTSPPPARNPG